MRASTERDDPNGGTDPFGQPTTSLTFPLTDQPCYQQARTENFVADGEKLVAVARHFILFPLETDVREQDRTVSITDRRGTVLKDTKLRVVSVVKRENHLEAQAEEYA